MSGSLGDYLNQVGRVGSGAQIPAPVVVNPLAAQAQGLDLAQKTLAFQNAQGQQLWGQALQQATDANGNVDYGKAQQLASRMGPAAASYALEALQSTAQQRGAQINQGIARNTSVNNAIIGALDGDDAGLHDRVVGGFKSLVANGVMTPDEATRSALVLPNDPTQLRQRLQQIQTSLSPPELQQEQLAGSHVTIATPQGTYVTTVPPTRRGGTVTTPHGPTPGATAKKTVFYDDQGVIPEDANGNPTRPPKGTQEIEVPVTAVPGMPQGAPPTYAPATTAPPPPPPGTTPRPMLGPYVPRPGAATAPPAATPPPPTDQPVTPPAATVAPPVGPVPSGATTAPMPGGVSRAPAGVPPPAPQTGGWTTGTLRRPDGSTQPLSLPPGATPPAGFTPATPNAGLPNYSMGGGGVQVASAAPFAPATGAAAPPSPAVAGNVAAIQAGIANARGAPGGGTQMAQTGPIFRSAPPSGFTETLQNDIKARTDLSAGANDQRRNLQAGENALQALDLAGGYTGPGTAWPSLAYAFLQAHDPTGAIPQGSMSETAWREVLAKNMLRFAQSSGMRMNTDLGLSEALQGTANADTLLPGANRHILIDDLGRARQRMAQTDTVPQPDVTGAVIDHVRNYTRDTDSRAFVYDLMSPAERKAIDDEIAKDKSGKVGKRFDKGLEDASRLGYIKPPGAPVTPGRQGSAQPVMPPAMTPPPNALAAANIAGPANALAAA